MVNASRSRWIAGLVVVVFLAMCGGEAFGIPAFARKYKTSCATCHEGFPRLNAVGDAFRLNGYKFADDDVYIKDEPVEMGDEAYKRVWPKAIWPSDIPGLPPIAIIFKSVLEIDTGGEKQARTEFKFPSEAKIMAAGALGDTLSFLVEIGFDRSGGGGHGGHGTASTETGVDIQGWLQIEDIIGPENMFNLRVGTVGMHEMGLFIARNHNRLSVNPYLYASWSMPTPTHHFHEAVGLTEYGSSYTGNPFTLHAQPGIEINGFGRTWRYAVGVVNGNGSNIGDNNSEKDMYFQFAYKIGGLGFDGSGAKDDGKLADSESWRDNSIIFSSFGYFGTNQVKISGTVDGGDPHDEDDDRTFIEDDEFCRIGFGIQGKYNDLAVRGGYVYGSNKRPFGAMTPDAVPSHSWFFEAEYFVYPWLIPYVRYEALQLELPTGVDGIDPTQDRDRVIVGAKFLIRANVSVTVEGRFHLRDERKGEQGDDDQVVIGIEAGF